MLRQLKENKIFKILVIYLSSMLKGGVVFAVGLSLIALIMETLNNDSALLYYGIYMFVVIGAFVCGIASHKKLRGRGFLIGVFSSIPYSLLVFVITSALSNFCINKNIVFVFILSIIGGFLGGITSANTRI